jgi:hypothetical protein
MAIYKIRTHNPWSVFLIALGSLFLPMLFLHNINEATFLIVELACFFSCQILCYYFVSDTIDVTVTENGISTDWMTPPFFTKTKKEILWTEIKYWDFSPVRAIDAFIIKTTDNKSYSIRCLSIYNRQKSLSKFADDFFSRIENYNIKTTPSLFEKIFGKIFNRDKE